MDPAWDAVARYASTHHGTISCVEAAQLGVASYRLAAWARSGRLSRVAQSTYVVTGSVASWHQRLRVATTSGDAWASHQSAAALWRLDGFRPGALHVLTMRGQRRRRRGWAVHESRTLRGVDLTTTERVACTSVVRTLLDLPAVVGADLVGVALDDATRRYPGVLQAVARRHAELPRRGRRGAATLTALLDERLSRGRYTDSAFEDLAVALVRSAGLPPPEVQYEVRDGDFVAYLDLAWPAVSWCVECDSLAWHSGKKPHEWDRRRRRRLKQLGWDGVEVTYDDVTIRREATGHELRVLYDARQEALLAATSAVAAEDAASTGAAWLRRSA
jgi:hypothetical protein